MLGSSNPGLLRLWNWQSDSPLKQKVMCKQSGGSCFCQNLYKLFLYSRKLWQVIFYLYAGQERMSPHRLYTSTPIPHPSTGTRSLTGPESIECFIECQAFLRWYDSAPPSPAHSHQQVVCLSLSTDGRGGGGRGSLVLYKSFNTLWTGQVDYVGLRDVPWEGFW